MIRRTEIVIEEIYQNANKLLETPLNKVDPADDLKTCPHFKCEFVDKCDGPCLYIKDGR